MQADAHDALAKTMRVNQLFDFYSGLLTDKQRTYLQCYFHDDFSLGEIAAEFGVSRQAVYEHIKRAGEALEQYEHKLGMLIRHSKQVEVVAGLTKQIQELPVADNQKDALLQSVRQLQIDERNQATGGDEDGCI